MDFKIRDNFFNFQWSTQNQQDICQYFVLNESLEYIEKHDPEIFIQKKITGENILTKCGKNINNYSQRTKIKNSQSIKITIKYFNVSDLTLSQKVIHALSYLS